MTMSRSDTPADAREEILITLRALAGLVAEALQRTAASGDQAAFARESAALVFWCDFQMSHTRRLLPAVLGDVDEAACRAFAAQLVHATYRDEQGVGGDDIDACGDASRRWPAGPAQAALMDPMERRK